MKEIYEVPVATVINLAAVENLAALNGHRDGDINVASSDDFVSVGHGTGSGRPA